MEEQDVIMVSADAEPSSTANLLSYLELGIGSSSPLQQNGVEFNGVDASLPSPGAESVSTGAASSDDSESDEDDDEGAEENERVDENGPIVIDDDKDTLDDDQEPPLIVKGEPSPSSAVICDSEAEKTKAAEANH